MSIVTVPWIIAVGAAVMFALLAGRAGKSRVLWALGGAFLGLVVTTIIWGVGQAADIPFSDRDMAMFHLRWTLESIGVVVACGLVLALSLRAKAQGQTNPSGEA